MSKLKEKKKRVKITRRNWDTDFYVDMINGNGFLISEPAEISLDGSKQKSMYGPQSPLYGTTYGDDQEFFERYRCQCGEFKSRQFEGEICPICGTPVEARGSDINVTGWISLGENRVISSYYYNLLHQTLGKNIFPDIIYAKYKITTDGRRIKPTEEDIDQKPSSPFVGIGVDEFYDRYEEILTYFMNTKKNKTKTLRRLIKEKNNVFVSHIPIPSTMLRPQSVTVDTFYFNSIDKDINTIYKLSESLKECIDVEKDFILQRIQTKLQNMWNIYFSEINGKEGMIRSELLGGSLNYTARNVICPAPDLHDNEISLSYHTALELFKYKIIYYYMKLNDVPLSRAYSVWKDAYRFDEQIYSIMEYLIKEEKLKVLINRNPTLNYYSMLLMGIKEIKKDDEDYSLSVPLAILPGLNADSTHLQSGSDRMVTPCKYVCERLTSGVGNYKIAC